MGSLWGSRDRERTSWPAGAASSADGQAKSRHTAWMLTAGPAAAAACLLVGTFRGFSEVGPGSQQRHARAGHRGCGRQRDAKLLQRRRRGPCRGEGGVGGEGLRVLQ